jgi:L-alanine-DL-glutamate epimerase-like enolase superfamily enzyme
MNGRERHSLCGPRERQPEQSYRYNSDHCSLQPQASALGRRFRLIGWQGLIGMAVSGLDMAFWDVIGRTLEQSVVTLLGGTPTALPAYDNYGMIDPKTVEAIKRRAICTGSLVTHRAPIFSPTGSMETF